MNIFGVTTPTVATTATEEEMSREPKKSKQCPTEVTAP